MNYLLGYNQNVDAVVTFNAETSVFLSADERVHNLLLPDEFVDNAKLKHGKKYRLTGSWNPVIEKLCTKDCKEIVPNTTGGSAE